MKSAPNKFNFLSVSDLKGSQREDLFLIKELNKSKMGFSSSCYIRRFKDINIESYINFIESQPQYSISFLCLIKDGKLVHNWQTKYDRPKEPNRVVFYNGDYSVYRIKPDLKMEDYIKYYNPISFLILK